jgi:hypothetical protein
MDNLMKDHSQNVMKLDGTFSVSFSARNQARKRAGQCPTAPSGGHFESSPAE